MQNNDAINILLAVLMTLIFSFLMNLAPQVLILHTGHSPYAALKT